MININKTLWENEYLNWRYNTLDIDEKYKACLTESKINENDIARVYDIKQEPQQIGDFIFKIEEKYLCETVNTFENFCFEQLYKTYQKYGFTKILFINRMEFEKFMLWALPLWKKIRTKYDEKIVIDIKRLIYWIEMLSTDGQNSKELVSEEMLEIVKKKIGGKKND